MKQDEKSRISRGRIISAAIIEFGTKSYDSSSLNNICNDNNISKGLIYHYFKNKDDLFLCCVQICFDELCGYLKKESNDFADFKQDIQKYLKLRYSFFADIPFLSNIFFNVVLQPPKHLIPQIKELRKEFDELNVTNYKGILSRVKLRDGVSEDDAIEYFLIFQEMFNGYFQTKANETADMLALAEMHEHSLAKILNIMLYGIVKDDGE